jgi:hypothetical protein
VRGDVLRAGICVFGDGASKFNCSIRNRSPDGARVSFPIVRKLPPQFWLIDVPGRHALSARLAWSGSSDAGMAILHKMDIGNIQDRSLAYLLDIWQDRTRR